MLEQEFCSLKAFRQGLANSLLDDSRSRKTNQCIRLRDNDITKECETRRYAAHGGVGKHRNEGQARACQLSQRCSRLRHLHQGHESFLHARSATGCEADERQVLFTTALHSTRKSFADHRAHRTAQKAKFEHGNDKRYVLDGPLHHDQSIFFTGVRSRVCQTLGVAFAVDKLQEVDRRYFRTDLELAFRIERQVDAFASGQAIVMSAFRADVEVFIEIRAIKYGLANFALAP